MVVTYTADSPIIGTGTVAAEAIDAFMALIGTERANSSAPDGQYLAPPAGLGAAIIAAAQRWNPTPDYTLMAAQCADETGGWQSAWARAHNNPAGIGVDGTPGVGETFRTPADGFVAQAAHLLDYAVGKGEWSLFDPRWPKQFPAPLLGSAPTLRGLNGHWAVPGSGYGQSIAALANRLVDFANNQSWGPTVPTVDISGFVPPRIVQQWFPVNGVSYMGEDMVMQGVCVHQTGNTAAGAEAQQNVDYMNSQACIQRQASWHATVGLDTIIETIPQTKQAYHASDGSGPGNTHFKAVEHVVCYPVGSAEYQQVMRNGAWYAAKSLRDAGLPCNADTLKQHHDFARDGKDCPMQFRDHNEWGTYTAYVQAFYDAGGTVQPAPQPADGRILVIGNPLGPYGYRLGFRARLEAIARAISPNDLDAGVLSVVGWAREDEWQGVDGCSYQRCERATLQYTPNKAAPWDIVLRPVLAGALPSKQS